MSAYYWSRACPGLYYLWDGPRQSSKSLAVGKVERQESGRYRIRALRSGYAETGRWTPSSAIAALEAHLGQPGDTFTRENF